MQLHLHSMAFDHVTVGLLSRQLEIASIDLHQTGSVGEGSDRLLMIKFWPSCAPGKGVCVGAKIFGSAVLQPARSVCVSERFFHLCCLLLLGGESEGGVEDDAEGKRKKKSKSKEWGTSAETFLNRTDNPLKGIRPRHTYRILQ